MGCRGRCVVLTILVVVLLHVVTGQDPLIIENIRLVGGNATAGRVEVQINGQWGTVCDDGWDNAEAQVVCKQLQLSGGIGLGQAAFGKGSGEILLDDVYCAGNEKDLDGCYFVSNSNSINCVHDEDASVICQPLGASTTPNPSTTTAQSGITQPNNCPTGDPQKRVQLFGPQAQNGVGFVQVKADNGTYGYVCDDGWDINAAKVVCNELCYNPALTEPGIKNEFRVGVNPVLFALDDVQCVGTESSLVDCQHRAWFTHNCRDTELAAVTCVTVAYSTPPPPSPNLQCRNGDLIALFNKTRDEKLEAKHLKLFYEQTNPCSQFVVDPSDPNYITVTIPFDDCGTTVTQNATHIIYNNTVLMEPTSREGAIRHVNEYVISLVCEMPRNATVDRDVRPLTEFITQRTEGEFVITMTVYEDRFFNQSASVYPFPVTLGDWLNAAVELESIDSRLKLVVPDCEASPNISDSSAPTHPLLDNKCVAPRSTLEVFPLSKVKVGLRLRSFIFVDYPLVVLQCDAIVCLTSEVTSECDRSCNSSKPAPSGRRRRDVSGTIAGESGSKTVYKVRTQPFTIVVPPATGSSASTTRSTISTTTVKITPATTTTTTTTSSTSSTTSSTTTTTTTTTQKPTTVQTSSSSSPNKTATANTPPTTTPTHSPTIITIRGTGKPATTTTTTTTTTKTSTMVPTISKGTTFKAQGGSLSTEGIVVVESSAPSLSVLSFVSVLFCISLCLSLSF